MPHQCTNCGRRFPDGSKEMLSGCPDCGGNKFQFAPSEAKAAERASAASTEEASGESTAETPSSSPSSSSPSTVGSSSGGVTGTVGRATDKVRDWVGSDDRPADGRTDDDHEWPDPDDPLGKQSGDDAADADEAGDAGTPSPPPGDADVEDTAQAEARSDVVSSDELPAEGSPDDATPAAGPEATPTGGPDATPPAETDGRVVGTPDDDPADTDDPTDIAELREELNDQFESIKILSPGQYELNLMELYDREEYIISLQEDGRYVIEVPESWHGSGRT